MTATGATQARNVSRPWLAHYPPAVPPELDDAKVGTLVDLIGSACSTYASRPAFESFGKTITFAETRQAAEAFAGWLQSRGLKKGDRVALMMPNILAYPAAIFGVLLGGFTVVNVNPL